MKKVQKIYTAEFKREAVRLAQTSGRSIAQVARELGISDTSIHQWRKELAAHGDEAFPGSGHQTAKAWGTAPSQTRTGGDPTGARHLKKSHAPAEHHRECTTVCRCHRGSTKRKINKSRYPVGDLSGKMIRFTKGGMPHAGSPYLLLWTRRPQAFRRCLPHPHQRRGQATQRTIPRRVLCTGQKEASDTLRVTRD